VKRNAKCNIVRENAFTVSQLKLEQTRNLSDKNISPQWSPRMMNNLDISEKKQYVSQNVRQLRKQSMRSC